MLPGRSGLFIALLFGCLFAYFGCYRAVTSAAGDFADYYTASRMALNGTFDNAAIYDYYKFEKSAGNYFKGTLSSFIPDPPSTALILIPLAWLPPETARVAFMLADLLCAALLVVMLVRLTHLPPVLLTVIVLLSGISLWSDVREGQVYLLLALVIVTALVLEKEGKRFGAGLLLGAALPVKYITALFVGYFLLRKRYRLVTGATIAAAAVFAAGFVLGGVKMNEYYLSVILPQHLAGNIQNPFSVYSQSFNSLLNRIFVPNTTLNAHPFIDAPFLGLWLRALVPLVALLLVVIAVFASRSFPEHERTMYSIAVLTLFGLSVSPVSASYHMTLLIIPMALLFAIAASEDTSQETVYLKSRMPLMFALYLAVSLVPYYKLYPSAGEFPLLLLSYSRLFLLAVFFVLAIPPTGFRGSAFSRLTAAAIVLSLLIGYARLPREGGGDGARWAGIHGLIIPRLYSEQNTLYYLRDTYRGYVRKKIEPVSDPAEASGMNEAGNFALTAFDSTVHDSSEIFLLDKRNGAVSQLTTSGLHNTDPVWNADHSRLYFLSDRGRGVGCTTIFYFPKNTLAPVRVGLRGIK